MVEILKHCMCGCIYEESECPNCSRVTDKDRIEELEAKLEKVIAVLHRIVDQRGYADDPWGIVQSSLAELKGESHE